MARSRDLPAEAHAPVAVDGVALLLTRDRAGTVRAFHNVCSHRGHPLSEAGCTRAARISCPYHGWSYGLDGALRSTPHFGGAGVHALDGFDRERHALKPVASACWWDLVFVNLDGTAPALEHWIEPLERRWSGLLGERGIERYLPAADPGFSLDVQGAWPLAVENYCESYHLPFVHPTLNSYSRIEDHYTIAEAGRFAGQGTRVYSPRYLEGEALVSHPAWPASRRETAEYVALFPNLLLGIHHDHAFSVVLEPLGPERTLERCSLYFVGDAACSEAHGASRERTREAWISVFEEDIPVVEGMQRGRRSPAYSGGAFSPVLEMGSMTFYDWLGQGRGRGRPVAVQSVPGGVE